MSIPENYSKKHDLEGLVQKACDTLGKVKKSSEVVFQPDWDDLYRLHHLCITRKVTTVLEFGCGFSSLVFADALKKNKENHGDYIQENLRRNNAFECHSVDDMPEFIASASDRMPENLKDFTLFHCSSVYMSTFQSRICTYYKTLPNICPDLIYLDGPSQSSVKGDVDGLSTDHPDRLPMAADLLRMEHFLLPGTLIVVDGRTANARFLQCNFQRNWQYTHLYKDDIHLFELRERPLGQYNERQIRYCLGDAWLDRIV